MVVENLTESKYTLQQHTAIYVSLSEKVADLGNVKHIRAKGKDVDDALRLGRNSRAQQMPRKHSDTC